LTISTIALSIMTLEHWIEPQTSSKSSVRLLSGCTATSFGVLRLAKLSVTLSGKQSVVVTREIHIK